MVALSRAEDIAAAFLSELRGVDEDESLALLGEADFDVYQASEFVINNLPRIRYALDAGMPVTAWGPAHKNASAQDKVLRAVRQFSEMARMLTLGYVNGLVSITELRAGLVEEFRRQARNAYVAGRRTMGDLRPMDRQMEQDFRSLIDDDEEDLAGGLGVDPLTAVAAGGLGSLLVAMVFDPTNYLGSGLPGDPFATLPPPIGAGKPAKSAKAAAERLAKAKATAVQQPAKAAARFAGAMDDYADRIRSISNAGEMAALSSLPDGATMVWWSLGPADHCIDCVRLADASPFYLSTLEGNGIWPGSGHTRCMGRCRCRLDYDVPTQVCADPLMGDVASVMEGLAVPSPDGDRLNVWVQEAVACKMPVNIDAINPTGDYSDIASDADAFNWSADVSSLINADDEVYDFAALTAKGASDDMKAASKAFAFLRTDLPAAELDAVRFTRYESVGSTYYAAWRRVGGNVRFEAGSTVVGSTVMDPEFTLRAIHDLAQRALDDGGQFVVAGTYASPGLLKWLDTLGAMQFVSTPVPPSVAIDWTKTGVVGVQPSSVWLPPKTGLDDAIKRVKGAKPIGTMGEQFASWPALVDEAFLDVKTGAPNTTVLTELPTGVASKQMFAVAAYDEAGDLVAGMTFSTQAGSLDALAVQRVATRPDATGKGWATRLYDHVQDATDYNLYPAVGDAVTADGKAFVTKWLAHRKAMVEPAVQSGAVKTVALPGPTVPLTSTNYIDPAFAAEVDALARTAAASSGLGPVDDVIAKMQANAEASVSGAVVQVRTTSAGLAGIVKDGRFRTQFEGVAKSKSAGALSGRIPAEQRMFGLAETADPTKRPIYGYLGHADHEPGGLDGYGEIVVRLKDDVRNRTSFGSFDSVHLGWATERPYGPSMMNEPKWWSVNGLRYQDADATKPVLASPDVLTKTAQTTPTYWEAQVHGGVALDDVAEVVFAKASDATSSLTSALDAAGVKWRVADPTGGLGVLPPAATMPLPPAVPEPPANLTQMLANQPTEAVPLPVTWANAQDAIAYLTAKYPGTEWTDLAKMDWQNALVAARTIDKMLTRFGSIPSFKGVRLYKGKPGVLAEVKRIDPNVPGSAVYLPSGIWKDRDAFLATAKGDATGYTTGSLITKNGGAADEYAESILVHEMGHEYMGLSLHSRFGVKGDAVRTEVDEWFAKFLGHDLDKALAGKTVPNGVTTYGKKNAHEAWSEVFTAALGYGRPYIDDANAHWADELAAILDKHYPAGAAAGPSATPLVNGPLILAEPQHTSSKLTDAYVKWHDQMPDDVAKAWEKYKAGSEALNDWLRAGQPEGFGGLTAALGAPLAEQVKLLDAAIAGSHLPDDQVVTVTSKLRKPLTVYRGRKVEVIPNVGDIVEDAAYLSTSISPTQAATFAAGDAIGKADKRVVYRIALPKGQEGAWMNSWWGYAYEEELVLPRGMKFRVTSKHDGVTLPVSEMEAAELGAKEVTVTVVDLVPEPKALVPEGPPIEPTTNAWKPGDPQQYKLPASDVPLNAPLAQWTGDIPVEPALPVTKVSKDEIAAAKQAAEDALPKWQDVIKVDGPRAIFSPSAAVADEAQQAGLIYAKVGGKRVIAENQQVIDDLTAYLAKADTSVDDMEFWALMGLDESAHEAEMTYRVLAGGNKRLTAGVMVFEPDGRVWVLAPKNKYAGYDNTVVKGGVDPGETAAAAAVREAREEMGLSVELDGYLGDYQNSNGTGIVRMYVAHRTGGGPLFADTKETYRARLLTVDEAKKALTRNGAPDPRDQAILADASAAVLGKPSVVDNIIGTSDLPGFTTMTEPLPVAPPVVGAAAPPVANADPMSFATQPVTIAAPPLSTSFGYDLGYVKQYQSVVTIPPATKFPMANDKWLLSSGESQAMYWKHEVHGADTVVFWANSKKQVLSDPTARMNLHVAQLLRFADTIDPDVAVALRVNDALLDQVPALRELLVYGGATKPTPGTTEIALADLKALAVAIRSDVPLAAAPPLIPTAPLVTEPVVVTPDGLPITTTAAMYAPVVDVYGPTELDIVAQVSGVNVTSNVAIKPDIISFVGTGYAKLSQPEAMALLKAQLGMLGKTADLNYLTVTTIQPSKHLVAAAGGDDAVKAILPNWDGVKVPVDDAIALADEALAEMVAAGLPPPPYYGGIIIPSAPAAAAPTPAASAAGGGFNAAEAATLKPTEMKASFADAMGTQALYTTRWTRTNGTMYDAIVVREGGSIRLTSIGDTSADAVVRQVQYMADLARLTNAPGVAIAGTVTDEMTGGVISLLESTGAVLSAQTGALTMTLEQADALVDGLFIVKPQAYLPDLLPATTLPESLGIDPLDIKLFTGADVANAPEVATTAAVPWVHRQVAVSGAPMGTTMTFRKDFADTVVTEFTPGILPATDITAAQLGVLRDLAHWTVRTEGKSARMLVPEAGVHPAVAAALVWSGGERMAGHVVLDDEALLKFMVGVVDGAVTPPAVVGAAMPGWDVPAIVAAAVDTPAKHLGDQMKLTAYGEMGGKVVWRRWSNVLEVHATEEATTGGILAHMVRMGKTFDDYPKLTTLRFTPAAIAGMGDELVAKVKAFGGVEYAGGIKMTAAQAKAMRDKLLADAVSAAPSPVVAAPAPPTPPAPSITPAAPAPPVPAPGIAEPTVLTTTQAGDASALLYDFTPGKYFDRYTWHPPEGGWDKGGVVITERRLAKELSFARITGDGDETRRYAASVRHLIDMTDNRLTDPKLTRIRFDGDAIADLPTDFLNLLNDAGAYGHGQGALWLDKADAQTLVAKLNADIASPAPGVAVAPTPAVSDADMGILGFGHDADVMTALTGDIGVTTPAGPADWWHTKYSVGGFDVPFNWTKHAQTGDIYLSAMYVPNLMNESEALAATFHHLGVLSGQVAPGEYLLIHSSVLPGDGGLKTWHHLLDAGATLDGGVLKLDSDQAKALYWHLTDNQPLVFPVVGAPPPGATLSQQFHLGSIKDYDASTANILIDFQMLDPMGSQLDVAVSSYGASTTLAAVTAPWGVPVATDKIAAINAVAYQVANAKSSVNGMAIAKDVWSDPNGTVQKLLKGVGATLDANDSYLLSMAQVETLVKHLDSNAPLPGPGAVAAPPPAVTPASAGVKLNAQMGWTEDVTTFKSDIKLDEDGFILSNPMTADSWEVTLDKTSDYAVIGGFMVSTDPDAAVAAVYHTAQAVANEEKFILGMKVEKTIWQAEPVEKLLKAAGAKFDDYTQQYVLTFEQSDILASHVFGNEPFHRLPHGSAAAATSHPSLNAPKPMLSDWALDDTTVKLAASTKPGLINLPDGTIMDIGIGNDTASIKVKVGVATADIHQMSFSMGGSLGVGGNDAEAAYLLALLKHAANVVPPGGALAINPLTLPTLNVWPSLTDTMKAYGLTVPASGGTLMWAKTDLDEFVAAYADELLGALAAPPVTDMAKAIDSANVASWTWSSDDIIATVHDNVSWDVYADALTTPGVVTFHDVVPGSGASALPPTSGEISAMAAMALATVSKDLDAKDILIITETFKTKAPDLWNAMASVSGADTWALSLGISADQMPDVIAAMKAGTMAAAPPVAPVAAAVTPPPQPSQLDALFNVTPDEVAAWSVSDTAQLTYGFTNTTYNGGPVIKNRLSGKTLTWESISKVKPNDALPVAIKHLDAMATTLAQNPNITTVRIFKTSQVGPKWEALLKTWGNAAPYKDDAVEMTKDQFLKMWEAVTDDLAGIPPVTIAPAVSPGVAAAQAEAPLADTLEQLVGVSAFGGAAAFTDMTSAAMPGVKLDWSAATKELTISDMTVPFGQPGWDTAYDEQVKALWMVADAAEKWKATVLVPEYVFMDAFTPALKQQMLGSGATVGDVLYLHPADIKKALGGGGGFQPITGVASTPDLAVANIIGTGDTLHTTLKGNGWGPTDVTGIQSHQLWSSPLSGGFDVPEGTFSFNMTPQGLFLHQANTSGDAAAKAVVWQGADAAHKYGKSLYIGQDVLDVMSPTLAAQVKAMGTLDATMFYKVDDPAALAVAMTNATPGVVAAAVPTPTPLAPQMTATPLHQTHGFLGDFIPKYKPGYDTGSYLGWGKTSYIGTGMKQLSITTEGVSYGGYTAKVGYKRLKDRVVVANWTPYGPAKADAAVNAAAAWHALKRLAEHAVEDGHGLFIPTVAIRKMGPESSSLFKSFGSKSKSLKTYGDGFELDLAGVKKMVAAMDADPLVAVATPPPAPAVAAALPTSPAPAAAAVPAPAAVPTPAPNTLSGAYKYDGAVAKGPPANSVNVVGQTPHGHVWSQFTTDAASVQWAKVKFGDAYVLEVRKVAGPAGKPVSGTTANTAMALWLRKSLPDAMADSSLSAVLIKKSAIGPEMQGIADMLTAFGAKETKTYWRLTAEQVKQLAKAIDDDAASWVGTPMVSPITPAMPQAKPTGPVVLGQAPKVASPSFIYGYDPAKVSTWSSAPPVKDTMTGTDGKPWQVFKPAGSTAGLAFTVSDSGKSIAIRGVVPGGSADETRDSVFAMLRHTIDEQEPRWTGADKERFIVAPDAYDAVPGLKQVLMDAGGKATSYPNLGEAIELTPDQARALREALTNDTMGKLKVSISTSSDYLGYAHTELEPLLLLEPKATATGHAWKASGDDVQTIVSVAKDGRSVVFAGLAGGGDASRAMATMAELHHMADVGYADVLVKADVIGLVPKLDKFLLSVGGKVDGDAIRLDAFAMNELRKSVSKNALPTLLGGKALDYSVVDDLAASGTLVADAAKKTLVANSGTRQVLSAEVAGHTIKAEISKAGGNIYWHSLARPAGSTVGQGRAATATHLRTMLNIAAQDSSVLRLDIDMAVVAEIPTLRGVLTKFGAKEVPGKEHYWSLDRAHIIKLRKQLEAELSALIPTGSSYIGQKAAAIAWPAADDLTLAPIGKLKGQTAKNVLTDADGNQWLFKPGDSGRGAATDVATATLAQMLGLPVPPVRTYTVTINGKQVTGSLQKMLPNVREISSLSDLTPKQQEAMLKHSILDWLTNNDDAHVGNWLIDENDQLWAIDKSRSWSTFNDGVHDTLRTDNDGNGGGTPLIFQFFRQVKRDPSILGNVKPQALAPTLRAIRNMSDEEFLRIIEPVTQVMNRGKYAGKPDALRAAMLKRKQETITDIERYFKHEVDAAIKANPAAVPDIWKRWSADGGRFNLDATPQDLYMERLAELNARFGTYTPQRYSQLAADGSLGKVRSLISSYFGSGVSGGKAVGGHHGKHYGSELIRPKLNAAQEKEWRELTAWAMLNIVTDPSLAAPSGMDQANLARRLFNPETGTFRLVRSTDRFGSDPSKYIDGYKREGIRDLIGTALGRHVQVATSNPVWIYMDVDPDQVFSSWVLGYGLNAGESEVLAADVRLDQIIAYRSNHNRIPDSELGMWDRPLSLL